MSAGIRAFVALELPAPVREAVIQAIASAGELPGKLAWVPPENFHLTLAFLGTCEPARLAELGQALAAIASRRAPFELELAASGAFPSLRRPSVLWVGLRESFELGALQAEVDVAARALGFPLETRPFHAHITCARVKFSAPGLGEGWAAAKVQPARWKAEAVSLMRSNSGREGTRYAALTRFAFKR